MSHQFEIEYLRGQIEYLRGANGVLTNAVKALLAHEELIAARDDSTSLIVIIKKAYLNHALELERDGVSEKYIEGSKDTLERLTSE